MLYFKFFFVGVVAFGVTVFMLIPVAGIHYVTSTSVEVTAYDLEPGTAYLPGERIELVEACMGSHSALSRTNAEDMCDCLADKAEDEGSRYDRVLLKVGFDPSLRAAAGLIHGLATSGLSRSQIREVGETATRRVSQIQSACSRKQYN